MAIDNVTRHATIASRLPMFNLLLAAVLFALVYFPTLRYLSTALVSQYAKVSVWKRLMAAFIDGLPAVAAWLIYRHSGSVYALAGAAIYLLLRDGIGGQSLGKLAIGLVVVNIQTGRFCSVKDSVLRN